MHTCLCNFRLSLSHCPHSLAVDTRVLAITPSEQLLWRSQRFHITTRLTTKLRQLRGVVLRLVFQGIPAETSCNGTSLGHRVTIAGVRVLYWHLWSNVRLALQNEAADSAGDRGEKLPPPWDRKIDICIIIVMKLLSWNSLFIKAIYSEWVSNCLTADQHKIGYLVPL